MTTNENQYHIYLRSTNERVPCTKEEFDNYYRDINAYRKKQQRHGRCVCPESRRLHCDMDRWPEGDQGSHHDGEALRLRYGAGC